MLHVDIPTRTDIERLITHRAAASVSIYLPTTPVTEEAQKDRIVLKNLAKSGLEQVRASGVPKSEADALEEALDDLVDDDAFWRLQANSLAVFATPTSVQTFRLPNQLTASVEVADRFFVKPLLRAVTVPQTAFVLALSANAVRVVEVSGDMPAFEIKVLGLPKDAASAVGKASVLGRSVSGRLQGAEGQKALLRQYARQVDAALRSLLGGRETPLILAANQPLDAIFRASNTYAHLVPAGIAGNSDEMSDADLAAASRQILDALHREELARLHALFAERSAQHRTTTDIAQAARAATHGAVAVLLVDIDETVAGTVDDDGAVHFADAASAASYGVVDQIAARAWLSGARVLGERRVDIPGGGSLAAILRYKF
jgi:Bacterial archaeo-eukaryotic release factor family 11